MSEADRMDQRLRVEMEVAEALFESFRRRRERGEDIDFEHLCREHPDLEESLRVLHSVAGSPGHASPAQGETLSLPGGPAAGGSSCGGLETVSSAVETPGSSTGCDPRGAVGTTLGPYKLLEVLGEGGMGIVYLAEQRQPVQRRVALKVIKHGMDTREVIARFEAERQALALMSHPSIARVLDAGTTSDARPFFVMEHVPGEPITQYCDRHRLSTRERLGLFIQVCEAVQHAHQKAIIHRDLKPSNVLVAVEYGKPLPKVIDFGIAKAIGHRLTEKTLHTEQGQLIGTPEYMSPEQAEMGALDIDTRADIYSLGVLLYEVLTGELPFSPEELRRAGYAEIQRIIRHEEPPRPSTRLATPGDASRRAAERRSTDLVRLLRELRGDLDWVCMKALEKDRVRRYATASELAADVERHLRDEPVLARPPGLGYRLSKFARKNRGLVTAAAVVLLALLAGLAATSVMYLRAEKQREEKALALGEKEKALEAKTAALAEKAEALRRSEGLRLTAESTAVLPRNPGLALLLAVEGSERAPGLIANNALLAALEACREKRLCLHRHWVTSAVFSPDGERVLTASGDGNARVWETATGKKMLTLRGRVDVASSAVFSRNGERMLTTSGDSTARIWDIASGKEVVTLCGHEERIQSAVFSPGGGHVLTASQDRTARIWEAANGKQIVTLCGHEGAVDSAVFNGNGEHVLTASWDKTARIWEAASGKQIVTLRGHVGFAYTAIFSPGGERVVTASNDKTARIWEAASGKEIVTLRGHEEDVVSAVFSPDGKQVLTASGDRTARIWEAASEKEIVTVLGHEHSVRSAVFSSGGDRVLTVSLDRTARIWEAASGKEIVRLHGHEAEIHSAVFSPDGERVLTASGDRTVRIWDAVSGKEIATLRGHEDWIRSAVFSRNGERVLTASGDRTARIWEAASGKEIATLRGHEGWIRSAVFSRNGERVLTASEDRTARIWEASGKEIVRLQGHEGEVYSAVFSPDGERVLTASRGVTARIWETTTGKEMVTLRGHAGVLNSAVFSRNGERVVTAFHDKTARIWEAASGKEIVTLRGHEESVVSAVFSPDGKQVLTASADGTARLWEAASGKEMVTLRGHEARVESAAFSPDGDRVLTASVDGTARIWPADPASAARARKHRELTPDEVDRFLIGTPEERSAYRRSRESGLIADDVEAFLRTGASGGWTRFFLLHLTEELRLLGKLAREGKESELERRYLDLARQAAVATRGDPDVLGILAEALSEQGDPKAALEALERGLRHPHASGANQKELEDLRKRQLPDLLTYASIDEALDGGEVLISEGASWRFFRGVSEPSPGLEWTLAGFDDREWERGPSGFGYGDEDDATVLADMKGRYTTLYVRQVFDAARFRKLRRLALEVLADDGFVAYLNGREVGRSLAGPAGSRLPHAAVADGLAPEPSSWTAIELDPSALEKGANSLAIQGLNQEKDSSDFSLVPVLEGYPEPGSVEDSHRFEGFRSRALEAGPSGKARLAYLEARLLQRAGKAAEALKGFEAVVGLDPSSAEPHLSIARCLRALGDPRRARDRLREALRASLGDDRRLWDLWFEVGAVDLRQDAAGMLAGFPVEGVEARGEGPAADYRWALEELAARSALRIDSGGEEHSDTLGRPWGRDRFYGSGFRHHGDKAGGATAPFTGDVAGTEDDPLYRTERWFQAGAPNPAGYRLPVPRGTYRVSLHFAEIYFKTGGDRVFQAVIEGRRVLEKHEPLQAGFAAAEKHTFEAQVDDGFLDITFVQLGPAEPQVSAIEVEAIAAGR